MEFEGHEWGTTETPGFVSAEEKKMGELGKEKGGL